MVVVVVYVRIVRVGPVPVNDMQTPKKNWDKFFSFGDFVVLVLPVGDVGDEVPHEPESLGARSIPNIHFYMNSCKSSIHYEFWV